MKPHSKLNTLGHPKRVVATLVTYNIDASSIVTSILFLATWLRSSTVMYSSIFVSSINTIRIPIAQPFTWYTLCSAPFLVCFTSKFVFFVAFSVILKKIFAINWIILYLLSNLLHSCLLSSSLLSKQSLSPSQMYILGTQLPLSHVKRSPKQVLPSLLQYSGGSSAPSPQSSSPSQYLNRYLKLLQYN